MLLDGTRIGRRGWWLTILIGLQVYREAPALVEQGNVGLGCFCRAGGVLLYNDVSSPAPGVII